MTPATTVSIPSGTWSVDPAHSSIEFRVKHLGISTVRGAFREFEGTVEIGDDVTSAKARGKVNAASLDTNEPNRDGHLRSPDFFDADNHPDITFESTAIKPLDEDTFEVTGDLTMHGVTSRSRSRSRRAEPNRIRGATSASGSRRSARSTAATGT